MRIPHAFLLLPVVMWAGVSRAQTHNQTTAQPSSACAHIPEAPDADTNTHEYNAGYHNGYLEACKAMSAPRAKAPSVQADSAINSDILVPSDPAGIPLAATRYIQWQASGDTAACMPETLSGIER